MPLLDHFRPPLSERRHWHSFHNSWATAISSQLNALLPEGYFAEANVQLRIEIDAAFGDTPPVAASDSWAVPEPRLSVPLELAEVAVEVTVFGQVGGPQLAAAVELVSPANKRRPTNREAFVSKCATYLRAGVGLAIADVVTARGGDLHGELLTRLGTPTAGESPLFAAAYRPVERNGAKLDVWREPLTVGGELPTLPLWLRGGLCLPLDLAASYERTVREQRVRVAG